ncbi:MAG: MBL fold metallo-hydrolase RNA specificity domain-containing protein, partial [Candidatus Andersenbacteria bacterium]
SINDPRNAVLITGYQAHGTTGRRLLEGATEIDLYGELFPVRAEILTFNEFSAHADGPYLTQYLNSVTGLKRIVLVHGEADQADELKQKLRAAHPTWEVVRPDEGDTVPIE